MHIAGGCYLEFCNEPFWSQLYGSGGRAAAALVRRSESVELSTYISEKQQAVLGCLAATFGFRVHSASSPFEVSFHYTHPLAVPTIRPRVGSMKHLTPMEVSNETILRFGFMEGSAIVHGAYVTYDPQSAFDPRPFSENGSHADHLAIVCNASEARKLTAVDSLDEAASKLVESGASVAVIKMGSAGALVRTAGSLSHVPAFQTSRVWPLGSGDVFAAIFAHEWGEAKKQPADAAESASRATAYYCDTQTLPIPLTEEVPDFAAIKPLSREAKPPQVYLAGPFFTIAQRWLIAELRLHLTEQGVKVFSPFHDVGHGVASDVVPQDIDAIRSSDAMLAVLDGLDAGTLFEVGYARAIGIPVVGFVQSESDESMKMLTGVNCTLCDDLVSAIYHTVWAVSNG